MQSLLAPGTLLGPACRGTGPSGYSQEDREGPPGPALPCAPFPAQLVCWQLGAPPSQGGASPRDEEASLGSQRLRGRPGALGPRAGKRSSPTWGNAG